MNRFALAALAAWSLAFAPDDCKECSSQKLCSAHLAEETATLKAAAVDLKAKDEAARQKALEKIAQLKDAHENAPSAAAAKALAAGLQDPSWKVRTATVKLLAKGQEREAALDAIAKSLADSRKDGVKWMSFSMTQGVTDEQKTFADYLKTTLDALVAMKDERAAKAVLDFAKRANGPMPQEMSLPMAESVAAVGTADAFEIVIERLAVTEPYGGLQAIHEILVKTATAKGGKELPEWGSGTSARWKKWLDAHRTLFPKKVAAK